MSKWIPKLQEIIGEPDGELYFIGHSIGCAAILRYLETLNEKQKVGGVVLVAGFTENVGYKEIQNFFETPLDLVKIKTKSQKGFVAIQSDNDPHVDLKYAGILKEKLGAEVIIKHNAQHFSGAIEGENSCLELPDVIANVEKLASK
jgi:predicted alpha/beta hydrolase family esterase